MRGARTVLVLGIVTLVAVGAVLFVDRGTDTPEPGGDIVFPALLEQVNSVTRVRVTGSEGTFAVARDGDAWVVEEKERHPADPDRVHKLLVGAAGMKRVEPKTSDPSATRSCGSRIRPARTRGRLDSSWRTRRAPCSRTGCSETAVPRSPTPAAPSSTSAWPTTRGRGSSRARSPAAGRSSTGWTASSPASTASACAPPRSSTPTARWSR